MNEVGPRMQRRFPWNTFKRWAKVQAGVAVVAAVLAAVGPMVFPGLRDLSGPGAVLILLAWTLASGAHLILPLGELLVDGGGDDPSHEPRWSDTEWDELHARLASSEARIRQVRDESASERRRLESWVGSISDAVLAVDSEGLPVFFNSRFASWFGQGRLALGEQARDSRVPGLGELFRSLEVLAAFRAVLGMPGFLASDEPRPTQVERVVTLPVSGHSASRTFALGIEALLDDEGRVQGAVGVFHDITDLKRTEQMRIDFVANASHELRTPLTAIKGYVDTLAQDVKEQRPENLVRYVEVIARNTDRLMSLVDDLLDLSQLESGDAGRDRAPFSTLELTERVLKQLQPLQEARRQRIARDGDALRMTGDSARIEQVLLNLVSNAIKYAPEGSAIRVAWLRDPVDGAVLLRVADDGPGIPVEHQSRIFERFYRVDKSRSRDEGGTGLGLSIVKHIVQAHGGQITLASAPGKGAEFTCRFPQDGLA